MSPYLPSSGHNAFDGGGIYLQPDTIHTATLLAANTASNTNSGPDCLATAGA